MPDAKYVLFNIHMKNLYMPESIPGPESAHMEESLSSKNVYVGDLDTEQFKISEFIYSMNIH